MSLLNFNDINIQQKNNQEIFQSFSKNEQFVSNQKIKKNNNIFTNDFSFKKQLFPSLIKNNQLNSNNNLLNNENIDISNFNTIQNENDNIYSKDNNILFSGHFNNNINNNNNNFNNNIQIQPFLTIKEENSFVNDKNKNNNYKNKLYHKKIFSSIKTSINFNYKSKKHEKILKSSEELEIEKINKEKLELKKLKNLNELNNLKFREKSPINSLSKKNSFLNIKRESKIFNNNNLSNLYSEIDGNNKSFLDDSEIDILTKKLNKITISNKNKKQNKININNNNKSLSLNESFSNISSKSKLNPPIINNYISFRKAFDPNSNNNNKINDGKNNKNFISKNFEIKNKKINIVSFESIVNKSKQEKKLLDKEYLKKKKLYNMKIKKNKY